MGWFLRYLDWVEVEEVFKNILEYGSTLRFLKLMRILSISLPTQSMFESALADRVYARKSLQRGRSTGIVSVPRIWITLKLCHSSLPRRTATTPHWICYTRYFKPSWTFQIGHFSIITIKLGEFIVLCLFWKRWNVMGLL